MYFFLKKKENLFVNALYRGRGPLTLPINTFVRAIWARDTPLYRGILPLTPFNKVHFALHKAPGFFYYGGQGPLNPQIFA